MPLYRVILRLTAPLGTPLVGPTLFGQLCWLIREGEGEAALTAWLDDPARAWRFSDGFPHGFLPRPLVRPKPLPPEKLHEAKERKKRPYVRRETWLAHRGDWDETALKLDDLAAEPRRMRRIAHNQAHRSGRGTLEEGGLFFLDEDWRFSPGAHGEKAADHVDLYVETEETVDRVLDLLTEMGQAGYGRDASTGRGRWEVRDVSEDHELAAGQGSRRMSLSRGIVDAATMREALWRLEPHFGRTGPQLSLTGVSPFKRPVALTRPGMSFTPMGQGPFGRMLSGVHPERPEIRLDARHIAIPFTERAGGTS